MRRPSDKDIVRLLNAVSGEVDATSSLPLHKGLRNQLRATADALEAAASRSSPAGSQKLADAIQIAMLETLPSDVLRRIAPEGDHAPAAGAIADALLADGWVHSSGAPSTREQIGALVRDAKTNWCAFSHRHGLDAKQEIAIDRLAELARPVPPFDPDCLTPNEADAYLLGKKSAQLGAPAPQNSVDAEKILRELLPAIARLENFYAEHNEPKKVRHFGRLRQRASAVADALVESGAPAGEPVAFIVSSGGDYWSEPMCDEEDAKGTAAAWKKDGLREPITIHPLGYLSSRSSPTPVPNRIPYISRDAVIAIIRANIVPHDPDWDGRTADALLAAICAATPASRSSGEDTADKIDAERWRWVRGRLTIREEEMMSGTKAACLDIRLGASRVDRVPHIRPEVDPLLEECIDVARRGKEGQ